MYRRYYSRGFKRQLKFQNKKHRSLANDVLLFLKVFNPDHAISLGHNLYKARLPCRSLHKGKSDAFRIIILVLRVHNLIAPVTLFFKSEMEDISEEEILEHTEAVYAELVEHGF